MGRVSVVVGGLPAERKAACHGPSLDSVVVLAVSAVVLHGRNSTETETETAESPRRRFSGISARFGRLSADVATSASDQIRGRFAADPSSSRSLAPTPETGSSLSGPDGGGRDARDGGGSEKAESVEGFEATSSTFRATERCSPLPSNHTYIFTLEKNVQPYRRAYPCRACHGLYL